VERQEWGARAERKEPGWQEVQLVLLKSQEAQGGWQGAQVLLESATRGEGQAAMQEWLSLMKKGARLVLQERQLLVLFWQVRQEGSQGRQALAVRLGTVRRMGQEAMQFWA
jgi:hypothetical protein